MVETAFALGGKGTGQGLSKNQEAKSERMKTLRVELRGCRETAQK